MLSYFGFNGPYGTKLRKIAEREALNSLYFMQQRLNLLYISVIQHGHDGQKKTAQQTDIHISDMRNNNGAELGPMGRWRDGSEEHQRR
ncbi:hypothetical protein HMPREF1870_00226 [Bacteroidales bacterium KA00344]|nr:hypothetical protein HMPREF1870_00226 [Bacteroidales bacterium KA00344]